MFSFLTKKNSSDQLPVAADYRTATAPNIINNSIAPAHLGQQLEPTNFEANVKALLGSQLAHLWLSNSPGDSDGDAVAQLVAIAAQACSEVRTAAGKDSESADGIFTDRLKSLQVLSILLLSPLRIIKSFGFLGASFRWHILLRV